jgi:hypothetical protein
VAFHEECKRYPLGTRGTTEISKQSQVSPKARTFCSSRRAAAKSCCASTPGKTPGTAAVRAPPPPHARGHWRCNRRCAAASRHLENLVLQPCVCHRHVTPRDISAAAAAVPLHLDAWQNARHCSHVYAPATSRLGTLVLQLPLRHCVLTPDKTPALQPCVRHRHVTPGDIGLLHLDPHAAMRLPPPRHARGHWHCSRRCAAAS